MSALIDRLRERIRLAGPITFHDWMKAALYDPDEGYYCRPDRERWGREGDYRTSPERSFLFSATFANYFAKLYSDLGRPRSWTICEAGGGAGHFAETVLQTFQEQHPQIFAATHYVFDEASATSRSLASKRLERFGVRVEVRRLEELKPLEPGIVFSNELLDSFPVHRLMLRSGELNEFYVGLSEGGSFEWVLKKPSKESLAWYVADQDCGLVEGQIVEVNLDIQDWIESVSQKIRSGYLVTVDYGAEAGELIGAPERRGGTLRAFHRHTLIDDVLARPGEQDLTTTVDWTLTKDAGAANRFEVVEFERLDKFLLKAGLLDQVDLMVNQTNLESEKLRLRSQAREMVLPGGMAVSFQVLVQRRI